MTHDHHDSEEEQPNQRKQAKARTRQKVHNAARTLFMEKGYELATIRSIAEKAGVSTGAVFANYDIKNDLFVTVMATELKEHEECLKTVAALSDVGSLRRSVLCLLAADYQFFLEGRFPLLEETFRLEGRMGAALKRERDVGRMLLSIRREAFESSLSSLGYIIPLAAVSEVLWSVHNDLLRRSVLDGLEVGDFTATLDHLVGHTLGV